jgi:hypothetical protein
MPTLANVVELAPQLGHEFERLGAQQVPLAVTNQAEIERAVPRLELDPLVEVQLLGRELTQQLVQVVAV